MLRRYYRVHTKPRAYNNQELFFLHKQEKKGIKVIYWKRQRQEESVCVAPLSFGYFYTIDISTAAVIVTCSVSHTRRFAFFKKEKKDKRNEKKKKRKT